MFRVKLDILPIVINEASHSECCRMILIMCSVVPVLNCNCDVEWEVGCTVMR
jgi:hypothetical protein